MKLKVIFALFLILMLIPLASGRSFSEIENRYIVIGAAIDFDSEKHEYIITAEVVSIEESSAGAVLTKYYTGRGSSLFDAIGSIIKTSGKRLYWAHTKVFIISKELASHSVYPLLDFAIRDPEFRDDILIVISREETAREIIECKSSKSSIPSNLINTMIENFKSTPKFPKVDFAEFGFDLSTPGIEPVAPTIEIVETDSARKLQIGGTAVFLQDKMVGLLNDNESMDLLMVRVKLDGGVINLDKNFTKLNTDLALEIYDSSTEIRPKIIDGNVIVEVIVKTRLGLAEIDSVLPATEVVVEKLNKAASSYLEKHITETIKAVQENYKSDIFGFGNKINISLLPYWKDVKQDWSNHFSTIEFLVKVDAKVSETGLIFKPINKE